MSEGEAAESLLGSTISDRYRIDAELGRGGMGVVYRAEHIELGQKVALKVLTSDVLATKTAVDRFLREARTTASLGHPNIVRVQDLGKLDDGRPYLVMELLDGEGLDDLLERERTLSPERAAPIVSQTAAALDAIHSLGLVHRDVKPENLFLSRAIDGTETVKLVDFGLVGMSRPDLDEQRLTKTGLIYGTPPYMAPETMAEKTPSPKWDVYSLAVVLFELLTGQIPLAGDTPLEYLTKRAMADPPRLEDAGRGRFPEAIEKVVRRGLSRFADARYESAGELAAAFAEAVGSGATVAAPEPAERRFETSGVTLDGRAPVSTPIAATPEVAEASDDDEVALPPARRRGAVAITVGAVLLGVVATAAFLATTGDDAPEAIADASREGAEVDPPPESSVPPPPETGAATRVDTEEEAPDDEPEDQVADDESELSMTGRRRRRSAMAESATGPTPEVDLAELEREANRALTTGNVARARDLFRQLTRAAPGRAAPWRGLGVSSERLGQRAEAARAYRRYLDLSPNAPDAAVVRGKLEALES